MARFQSGSEIREVVLAADTEDARRDYCDAQRELFAAGWVRVRDPAREIDYPEDTARDEALEHALHESPDDDQLWLVYADCYIDHGHPRGPLMAIESAPVKNIVQRAEREADAHRMRIELGDALAMGITAHAGLNLRWRRGFIYRAVLHGEFLRGVVEDRLFDLLRHPSARFLRELAINCSHVDAQDHRLLVDVLLHAAPPLRSLAIAYESERWAGYAPLGDLGSLGSVYPLLEDVRLDGDNTTRFAGLSLPRVKRFELRTMELPAHTLRELGRAPWPALEELVVGLHATSCTFEDARFVLALPRLERLRMIAAPFANELVEALVASPLAARLQILDLRESRFDDHGAAILAAARSRFPQKLRCYISRTRVSSDGRELLEAADIDIERW
jgi:uncharacterized protein (TIGR02996 family)